MTQAQHMQPQQTEVKEGCPQVSLTEVPYALAVGFSNATLGTIINTNLQYTPTAAKSSASTLGWGGLVAITVMMLCTYLSEIIL
jgi:hypothetical protein